MKKLLLMLIVLTPGWLCAQVTLKGVVYEQLSDAIEAATLSGDTVKVAGPVVLNRQVSFTHTSGVRTILGTTNDAKISLSNGSRFILEGANGQTVFSKLSILGAEQANADWGAMFTLFNGPVLELFDDTLRGAKTDAHAGAIRVTANATLHAYRTVFADNESNQNGGVAFIEGQNTETIFENCLFINNLCGSNSVDAKGGALFYAQGAVVKDHIVKSSAFINNKSNNHGGAIGMESMSPVFVNCTFSGNSAIDNGGCIWMWNGGGESTTTTVNCTFYNNSAANGSVFFGNQPVSKYDVINCVLAENGATPVGFAEPTTISIRNSFFPTLAEGTTVQGTNNINEGDLFLADIDVEAGIFYHDVTDDESVLVELGSGSLLKPYSRKDQKGNDRNVDGNVTAGSIERPLPPLILSATRETTNQLSVYPNPSAEYIVVKALYPGKVSVYNTNGTVMMTVNVKVGENRIDISSLPRSTYMVQHSSGKGTQINRLVKK
jgi:hypothetical protein